MLALHNKRRQPDQEDRPSDQQATTTTRVEEDVVVAANHKIPAITETRCHQLFFVSMANRPRLSSSSLHHHVPQCRGELVVLLLVTTLEWCFRRRRRRPSLWAILQDMTLLGEAV